MQSAAAAPTRRARVAAEIAELCDVITHAELADGDLEHIQQHVRAACAVAESGETGGVGPNAGRPKWWHDPSSPGRAYRERGPFTGVENPRSPGLVIGGPTSDAAGQTIEGRVTLGKSFAGPPGAVHGGVLAGLFDEMLGQAAQLAAPGALVVTATLTTRFRLPTPLGTPLLFTATVEPRSSRRFRAVATCVANDRVTADAVALLVVRS